MAKRRADAGGEIPVEPRQAPDDERVKRVGEVLDPIVSHVLAAIRAERADRKRIAKPRHGPREQRRGIALKRQHGPFAAAHDIVGRRGDIQQDQHRQIAVPALQHRVDARIGRVSGALGYCGDDAGIEIETISLRLTVPANRPTNLGGTNQGGEAVDDLAIAFLQLLDRS